MDASALAFIPAPSSHLSLAVSGQGDFHSMIYCMLIIRMMIDNFPAIRLEIFEFRALKTSSVPFHFFFFLDIYAF